MDREKLIEIFQDTLNSCDTKNKLLVDIAKNIFFDENYFPNNLEYYSDLKPHIKVVKKTTIQAVEYYSFDKVYGVLNFASAKHPGGGVERGTVAQEESIARVSTLFPVIKQCVEFYTPTTAPYYTDKIIYSKPIFILKDDYGIKFDNPFECDVITCAAPNYNDREIDIEEHKKVLKRRFTKVLQTAILNKRRNLILGAWGCGVFKNPPEINAKVFKDVLIDFSNYFDDIIFAIPDDKNFEVFKNILI